MESKKLKSIDNLKLLISTIWKLNKYYILVMLINSSFDALSTLINIFVPMIFIRGFQENWGFERYFFVLGLIVVLKLILKTVVNVTNRELRVQNEAMSMEFPQEISKKIMEMDYDKLEDPEILDLKEKALYPITNYGAVSNLLVSTSTGITSVLTILGTIGIIIPFSKILLVVTLVLTFLSIYIDDKFSKYLQEFAQGIVPINRKYGYYMGLMWEPTYQKEIRLFNMKNLITKRAEEYIGNVFDEMNKMYATQANVSSIRILIQTLIRFTTYSYVAARVISERFGPSIGIGQFTVIVGANENFITSFKGAFTAAFDIRMSLYHLEPFSEFMRLDVEDKEEKELVPGDLEELEFKNVSFTYPNSDREILDNISFKINKGEKISIVGLNNAGKSTIVKLICRFFKPNSGEILWNGINIKEYNKEKYMEKLSCVFQDFALFPLSIKDNIVADKDFFKEKVYKIIEDVSLLNRINSLPEGIDTYLNKEIYDGGTDFSGGEKQKLAISRGIYRNGELVILDEPTAALDPLAESEIYENFNELTNNKTSIFISHRMSSSKFCDKVLLLDDGKIVDFDSHENLMKGNNLYKDLYLAQAQYFNNN